MEKNAKLASIYVKIYNKRTLTIDDLTFLAKYDPECFAKTCENLIYKIPETRELMTQELATQEPEEIQMAEEADAQAAQRTEDDRQKIEEEHIRQLLLNLRDMKEMPVNQVDPDRVKNLLGSLYMEKLFPHNDKNRYFEMPEEPGKFIFNKKV